MDRWNVHNPVRPRLGTSPACLQFARLKFLEIQSCDEPALQMWESCRLAHSNLPAGVRIDLPSQRAFARVLGVYRSAATLKYLSAFAEEMKASGFVAEGLKRSNQPDAAVAPPAPG